MARGIDIDDHLFLREPMLHVILLEEGTQGLQAQLIHIGEEALNVARWSNCSRPKSAMKERAKEHTTLEAFFERRLGTYGIAL